MSDRLDEAFAKVRQLPEERQGEVADMLFNLVEQETSELRLSPEQLADLDERLAEPPDYASDEEVKAFFKRFTG